MSGIQLGKFKDEKGMLYTIRDVIVPPGVIQLKLPSYTTIQNAWLNHINQFCSKMVMSHHASSYHCSFILGEIEKMTIEYEIEFLPNNQVDLIAKQVSSDVKDKMCCMC